MATFEYLAALVSVVVGLGIAQALRGAGHIVHARDSIQIYVPHLIWLLNVILWMVVFWWFSFGLACTGLLSALWDNRRYGRCLPR